MLLLDGFIPVEDSSTIRLPPPHEMTQPDAPPGPYCTYIRFPNPYLQFFLKMALYHMLMMILPSDYLPHTK